MEDTSVETPDALLIEACLQGNEKAWQILVNRYRRFVYSIPIKWGLSADDAVDIFQTVWLDCFRQLASLRNIDLLQPWLRRVAIRKCYRLTSDMRARAETSVADEEMEELGEIDEVSRLLDLDKEQLVRNALEKLTPRCRQIIECLFFEEPRPSYQAVASRLGLSQNSIGFTRERCLNSLKKILTEGGYEP